MVFPSAEPVYEFESNAIPKEGLVDGLVDGLVESQQKIVRAIIINPKISIKQMSESIGISTTAIDNNIKYLKEKNIIVRVGSDRNGQWALGSGL